MVCISRFVTYTGGTDVAGPPSVGRVGNGVSVHFMVSSAIAPYFHATLRRILTACSTSRMLCPAGKWALPDEGGGVGIYSNVMSLRKKERICLSDTHDITAVDEVALVMAEEGHLPESLLEFGLDLVLVVCRA